MLDRPQAEPRPSDQQISEELASYQRQILANAHSALQSRKFIADVMKSAASGGPALRAALIAFIDSSLQGEQLGVSVFRKFVEDNLPALGIAREEIPTLARWAAKSSELQLRRDRLVADA